jgi:hypothetical protein
VSIEKASTFQYTARPIQSFRPHKPAVLHLPDDMAAPSSLKTAFGFICRQHKGQNQRGYNEIGAPVKLKKPVKLKTAARSGIVLACVGIILHFRIGAALDSGPIAGLQPASAATRYGILGQQAPELNLSTWIDGDGKQIEPIRLGTFRGKVIYLFFFQNW